MGLSRREFAHAPGPCACPCPDTPNAQTIAFQQVVPELIADLSSCPKLKKLLALLLALGDCEVVTPSPNSVWSWRRGSESTLYRRVCGVKMPEKRETQLKFA